MANTVGDLRLGGKDAMGVDIVAVYGRKPPEYAVYRTPERVLLHYADATALACAQRKSMARLNPLRGEINGLIDGWRLKKKGGGLQRKAERYDRRVGDALILAFEDDVPTAEVLLETIKRDILHERTSWARFEYLMAAFATAVLAMISMAILTVLGDYKGPGLDLWRAAAGGTIGAFFSISLAIRTRTILPDLQRAGNMVDAILRILIGLIAAAVLVSLMHSGAITLSLGEARLGAPGKEGWLFILTVGFLAGFSERFVPDLLGKMGASIEATPTKAQEKAAVAAAAVAAQQAATSSSGAAPPAEAAANDADLEHHGHEAGVDNCACDIHLEDDELTDDADLPIAAGGVSRLDSN